MLRSHNICEYRNKLHCHQLPSPLARHASSKKKGNIVVDSHWFDFADFSSVEIFSHDNLDQF